MLQTSEKRLIGLDDRAKSLFAPYTDTAPIRALDLLSKLGDQPELRAIAGCLLVAGTFASNDRLVRAGARMLIAHEAATVVKDLIKTNMDRTRPRSAKSGSAKRPKKGDHTAEEKTSFPSGHSAGAIAAARAFSREFPEYGAIAVGGRCTHCRFAGLEMRALSNRRRRWTRHRTRDRGSDQRRLECCENG